jgi:hypothetical protein
MTVVNQSAHLAQMNRDPTIITATSDKTATQNTGSNDSSPWNLGGASFCAVHVAFLTTLSVLCFSNCWPLVLGIGSHEMWFVTFSWYIGFMDTVLVLQKKSLMCTLEKLGSHAPSLYPTWACCCEKSKWFKLYKCMSISFNDGETQGGIGMMHIGIFILETTACPPCTHLGGHPSEHFRV